MLVASYIFGITAYVLALLFYFAFGGFTGAFILSVCTLPLAGFAAAFGAARLAALAVYWTLSLLLYVFFLQPVRGGIFYFVFFCIGILLTVMTFIDWRLNARA